MAEKKAAPAKTTAAPVKTAVPAATAKTAAPAAAKTPVPAVSGPAVPESVLKRKKRNEKLNSQAVEKRKALKLSRKVSRRAIFKKAEQYAKEYRAQEKSLVKFRRQAKAAGNFFVEPEARLAFVIRIRGINGVHPKPRKILQLLRLRQIHNGVFIRLTAATSKMLKLVEPYITYGYPNIKTIRELLYKRGYGKINGARIPLTDNSIIEQKLSRTGMVCIEDLIHEIYTVGPHFREASKFLWPFKLSSPNGGFTKITTHFIEGGDAGLREEKINDLVRQMN